MRKVIYDKNTLAIIGVYNENDELPEINVLHDVINVECGGRFHLERNELNEFIVIEDIEIIEDKRNQILSQLAQLDIEIPRVIEDIIEQGKFKLHQSKLDIIEQKQALRQQLKELEQK